MQRNAALVLCATLGVALLSACTKARQAGPPAENVFRFPVEMKIRSLDPHVTNDVYSSQTQALAYESLYQYHPFKRPFELEPVLAESLPVVSKNFKKLTIKLKKGVHFHDDPCFEGGKGREFKADDVLYMFHRIASPKFITPVYGAWEGRIVGIDDYHAGKTDTISGIKKVDDYTIEINLTQALPRFVYNFVDSHTAIVPKECVEKLGDEFARHPVGTGPFKITQVDLNSKVVAVKNPNYKHVVYPNVGMPGDKEKGLLDDAGKQLPFVDKVVFEVIVETQPQWLKFLAGELEVAAIPKDSFGSALPGNKLSPELQARGIQHFRHPRSDVTVHIFNMKDSIYGKHKEIRQAIQLAFDFDKIIELQYAGQAIRAHSMIDPSQYGYEPEYKSKWGARNLAKAKELLAKAGYPDGKGLPPIVMPTNEGATARNLDELVKRQLAEIGVQIKSEPMTWPEFDKRYRAGNYTMIGMGMASNVPDVEDVLPMYHSKNWSPGQNAAYYKNPEVDKLIEEIEALPSGPKRLEKIRRFKEITDEELPYAPGVHRIANQLWQPWVKNTVYMDKLMISPWLKYVRVQTAGEKAADKK